ncbi:MAG: hypothetical protein LBR94_02305 [Desulfovibrio sp.]|jgi:ferredoxin|nr:hypothetical protein [Desulfovibrio sp.]
MNALHADKVRAMLDGNAVTAVLGLADGTEGPVPHIFTNVAEVDKLGDGPKYPLGKIAWRTLRAMPPGAHLAVVCRTCDFRAIREQEKMGQFPQRMVTCLVVPCDAKQADRCSCSWPVPEQAHAENPVAALPADTRELLESADRSRLWRGHMQRCIKCYGCRNVCPVCICPECRLEDPLFVPPVVLPPTPLPYHLLRALHVAGHCVNCGACQDACPAGIPLLALHKALSGYLFENAGQLAGKDDPSPRHAGFFSGPTGTDRPEWKNGYGICASKGENV